jgi:hypothetical protein
LNNVEKVYTQTTSQPTYLKELKNAGLIKGSVEEMLFYCLNEDGFTRRNTFLMLSIPTLTK